MNKNILFLEDNINGISQLAIYLRHKGVHCEITSDLNAWKTSIQKYKHNDKVFDLLIIDDNLYKEDTLSKLDNPLIGTNGGSNTGSEVAKLLRSSDAPDYLKQYKNIPIIIYSVHTLERIKANIGNLDNVFIFEKLKGEEGEEKINQKCREILELS